MHINGLFYTSNRLHVSFHPLILHQDRVFSGSDVMDLLKVSSFTASSLAFWLSTSLLIPVCFTFTFLSHRTMLCHSNQSMLFVPTAPTFQKTVLHSSVSTFTARDNLRRSRPSLRSTNTFPYVLRAQIPAPSTSTDPSSNAMNSSSSETLVCTSLTATTISKQLEQVCMGDSGTKTKHRIESTRSLFL